MNTKKLLISFFVFLLAIFFISNADAEEKKKPEKVKGKIITNLENNYVKVIAADYKVHTIYFNKKTQVEATVKAKISDLAIAKEGSNFPQGTVTFVIKDGKSVAQKISYKSGASWGIMKKKKKKK